MKHNPFRVIYLIFDCQVDFDVNNVILQGMALYKSYYYFYYLKPFQFYLSVILHFVKGDTLVLVLLLLFFFIFF